MSFHPRHITLGRRGPVFFPSYRRLSIVLIQTPLPGSPGEARITSTCSARWPSSQPSRAFREQRLPIGGCYTPPEFSPSQTLRKWFKEEPTSPSGPLPGTSSLVPGQDSLGVGPKCYLPRPHLRPTTSSLLTRDPVPLSPCWLPLGSAGSFIFVQGSQPFLCPPPLLPGALGIQEEAFGDALPVSAVR